MTNMAITRMKMVADLPPEDNLGLVQPENGVNWPTQGIICFNRVSTRYHLDSPLALEDIGFTASAGQRIGICGRTGSGKSTLFNVLFRMLECETGNITIDGLDISTISRQELRGSLSAIPQDPMLLVRHLPLKHAINILTPV